MLPVKLASIGFGECLYETSDADKVFFEKLKEALKLRETTSGQLLAALIWHGIPNVESNGMYCYATIRKRLFSVMHGSFSA